MTTVIKIEKNDLLSKRIIQKYNFSYGDCVVVKMDGDNLISCEAFEKDSFINQSMERFLEDIKKDGFSSEDEWNDYLKQIRREARLDYARQNNH